jgi:hypothetical protein
MSEPSISLANLKEVDLLSSTVLLGINGWQLTASTNADMVTLYVHNDTCESRIELCTMAPGKFSIWSRNGLMLIRTSTQLRVYNVAEWETGGPFTAMIAMLPSDTMVCPSLPIRKATIYEAVKHLRIKAPGKYVNVSMSTFQLGDTLYNPFTGMRVRIIEGIQCSPTTQNGKVYLCTHTNPPRHYEVPDDFLGFFTHQRPMQPVAVLRTRADSCTNPQHSIRPIGCL